MCGHCAQLPLEERKDKSLGIMESEALFTFKGEGLEGGKYKYGNIAVLIEVFLRYWTRKIGIGGD